MTRKNASFLFWMVALGATSALLVWALRVGSLDGAAYFIAAIALAAGFVVVDRPRPIA